MEHYVRTNETKASIAFERYIFGLQASLRVKIYAKLRTGNLARMHNSFIRGACC